MRKITLLLRIRPHDIPSLTKEIGQATLRLVTTENPQQHLADDLRARRIDVATQSERQDEIALTDLKRGDRATICSYATQPDSAISRRLFDLGFVAGATIELIRKAPLGDPLMVRIAGADMLLRRQEARQIRVARLDAEKENS